MRLSRNLNTRYSAWHIVPDGLMGGTCCSTGVSSFSVPVESVWPDVPLDFVCNQCRKSCGLPTNDSLGSLGLWGETLAGYLAKQALEPEPAALAELVGEEPWSCAKPKCCHEEPEQCWLVAG